MLELSPAEYGGAIPPTAKAGGLPSAKDRDFRPR